MTLRLITILSCLLLAATTGLGDPPCDQLKRKPAAWVETNVDSLVRAAHSAFDSDDARPAYDRILDNIVNRMRECRLSEDQPFIDRYTRFTEYIDALSLERRPDHELGFVVPDKQYFEETRSLVQIPEFLLDRTFLQDVSRYETLARAKSYLRLLNSTRDPSDQLIFFSYKSRHLGTPDNDDSFRRLLIVVPGNAAKGIPEKWVQFGVTDPGERVRIRNTSVVAAMVGTDGTYNSYFKDYYRTYRRDGSVSINGRWELGYGDDNCASCHKSGVLPIFPVAGSVSPGEMEAVQTVNARFRTYGSPRFDKYLDATKFGPGLSAATTADRVARFGKRFEGTAVAHGMSCNACHIPQDLGYLNWPMDQIIINSFITGGQMPRGYALGHAERADLYAKLIEEYFAIDQNHPGILKAWLLGNSDKNDAVDMTEAFIAGHDAKPTTP